MKRWDSHFISVEDARERGNSRWAAEQWDYVAFHDLPASSRARARNAYSVTGGWARTIKYRLIHEHYYYPVDENGNLPNRGPRVLAIPESKLNNDRYMASLGYKVTPAWAKEHSYDRS